MGTLLVFDGGKFASSYRVKDRQLTVVNRHLGKEDMTLTVIDNDTNKEGKFLPRSYQVQYWDARTGQLRRTELAQNRWTRIGSLDLPSLLQSLTSDDAGTTLRTITLRDHSLHKK